MTCVIIHPSASEIIHHIYCLVLAARMLGLTEAPPAYELTSDQSCDSSGMTFAFGGAGVFKVTSTAKKVPTLAAQVEAFKRLVNDGVISTRQLRHSVALIAISGNDYMSGSDANNGFYSSFDDVSSSYHTHTYTN